MQNVGDYNPDRLDIVYYHSDRPSSYTLFDDDLHSTGTLATGKHRLIHFAATPSGGGSYTITIDGKGTIAGDSPRKEYRLVMPGLGAQPRDVMVNGRKAKKVTYDASSGTLTVPLSISNIAATTTIEVVK